MTFRKLGSALEIAIYKHLEQAGRQTPAEVAKALQIDEHTAKETLFDMGDKTLLRYYPMTSHFEIFTQADFMRMLANVRTPERIE